MELSSLPVKLSLIILVYCGQNQGNGARMHGIHQQYELLGGTVYLSLGEERSTQIKWKKDREVIAMVDREWSATRFQDKFIVNASDGSLIIKNVTERDSGRYQALLGKWEENIVEFHLIVLEAVSEPIIGSVLHRSDSLTCNFSVQCSAGGDSVTYDCSLQHCAPSNISLTRVEITIAIDNGLVECTASNRVSTKKSLRQINDTCSETSAAWHSPWMTVGWALGGTLPVCFLIMSFYCYRTKLQTTNQDTVVLYSVWDEPETPTEDSAAKTTLSAAGHSFKLCKIPKIN
ncbi:uncharacterized protein LOC118825988 [Colossoma macropomum]|uniref:uncharacterized protein LOC118825988 n=1 Tax=Colossoma macropomum TaxID=42526 RepID=UPI00186456C2|nr:uncharacterized protein LOC118825988 [Colossoma macropomum]